jgi:hypothetical protein
MSLRYSAADARRAGEYVNGGFACAANLPVAGGSDSPGWNRSGIAPGGPIAIAPKAADWDSFGSVAKSGDNAGALAPALSSLTISEGFGTERGGFEPPKRLLVYSISSAAPSAARTPLQAPFSDPYCDPAKAVDDHGIVRSAGQAARRRSKMYRSEKRSLQPG